MITIILHNTPESPSASQALRRRVTKCSASPMRHPACQWIQWEVFKVRVVFGASDVSGNKPGDTSSLGVGIHTRSTLSYYKCQNGTRSKACFLAHKTVLFTNDEVLQILAYEDQIIRAVVSTKTTTPYKSRDISRIPAPWPRSRRGSSCQERVLVVLAQYKMCTGAEPT